MSGLDSGSGSEATRWEALAREAARRRESGDAREELWQLLVFTLDGTPYAVPVERVREIVRMRPITPVPRVPREVRGVISLRGEIIQVIDLRDRLGLPTAGPAASTRIVVVHGGEECVAGVLVDRVNEVLSVAEDELRQESSGEVGGVDALCLRDGEFVSLIDLDRVLAIHADG